MHIVTRNIISGKNVLAKDLSLGQFFGDFLVLDPLTRQNAIAPFEITFGTSGVYYSAS